MDHLRALLPSIKTEGINLLHTIVTTLNSNINSPKYQRLRYGNKRSKLRKALSPESVRFLLILGFVHDPATEDLVFDAGGRTSDVIQQFLREAATLLQEARVADHAAVAREEKKQIELRLPSEPALGAAGSTTIAVQLVRGGSSSNNGSDAGSNTVSRRFAADDTLASVRRWLQLTLPLAAEAETAAFTLVDRTAHPPRSLPSDLDTFTLQALSLWPTARIAVVVASEDKKREDEEQQRRAALRKKSKALSKSRPPPSVVLGAHTQRFIGSDAEAPTPRSHFGRRGRNGTATGGDRSHYQPLANILAAAAEARRASSMKPPISSTTPPVDGAASHSVSPPPPSSPSLQPFGAPLASAAEVGVRMELDVAEQERLDEALALQLQREEESRVSRMTEARA